MSTFIYLDNYRGFSNSLIPVEQVNFLVGENSTGKSSFLDVLTTLYSVEFWAFDAELNRSILENKNFHDLVSIASTNKNSFSIGVIGDGDDSDELHATPFATLVTYKNSEGRPRLTKYTSCKNNSLISVVRGLDREKSRGTLSVRHQAGTPSKVLGFAQSVITEHKSNKGFKQVKVSDSFIGAPFLLQVEQLRNTATDPSKVIAEIPAPFDPGLVKLAPIRTRPLRTYDQPQTGFSPEGTHTPYVIRKQLSTKSHADSFRDSLTKIGVDSGLFAQLSIKEYRKTAMAPFELDIILDKHALSIDNVGYGVSQALPVFVEMLVRRPGSTFAIQQPEVHLHPKAQATVGDMIAELARHEKKSFYIETHSDYTIDRFRINLKKSENHQVKSQILFFERFNGGNRVSSIAISKTGEISSNQPSAYREFFLNEQLELLT